MCIRKFNRRILYSNFSYLQFSRSEPKTVFLQQASHPIWLPVLAQGPVQQIFTTVNAFGFMTDQMCSGSTSRDT